MKKIEMYLGPIEHVIEDVLEINLICYHLRQRAFVFHAKP